LFEDDKKYKKDTLKDFYQNQTQNENQLFFNYVLPHFGERVYIVFKV